MIICITGTPATGKTTLAKILAEKLDHEYIDVKNLIEKERLYDSFDKKRDSYVVDTDKLGRFLVGLIEKKKDLIIDSLLSHHLSKKCVDLVIVTKCGLPELKKRLEKRKYSKEKVRENLDSEIFDVCFIEAKENGHKVLTIDSTKGFMKADIDRLIKERN
ncbi:AAA family ATPase [Candidatus Woesearchaeota archaeon]|nr:AAA family ATPase [Candidatus Woesearchaeota archaeon]